MITQEKPLFPMFELLAPDCCRHVYFHVNSNTFYQLIQVAALRRVSLSKVLAVNRKNIRDIYDC